MIPPTRTPKTAIVPRAFLGVALTTTVPACALALASACSSSNEQPRKDYTFVADVSAHFADHIFVADVSAHFDSGDVGDPGDAPSDHIFIADVTAHFDAGDAADARADGDANEDAG